MDAALQVRSHSTEDHLPCPSGHTFVAAHGVVTFLGCKDTLLALCPVPPSLFRQAVLYPYILQVVLLVGVAVAEVQTLLLA